MPDSRLLPMPAFEAAALDPRVRSFYERTSDWRLEVWAQWCSAAWPFGWLIACVFAQPLEQLALPLRPLEVAHGMSSQVVGPDGSLVLSSGRGSWGSAGAYLVVNPPGRRRAWARRIPVHERFSVHVDAEGVLRTDHAIDLGRLPVLRLHYRLDRIG